MKAKMPVRPIRDQLIMTHHFISLPDEISIPYWYEVELGMHTNAELRGQGRSWTHFLSGLSRVGHGALGAIVDICM